jgi:gluconokinase
MICILMGVSGSGKSTIAQLLSQKLGWKFYDADNFHSEANIQKMSQGIPLNDGDRLPWLQAIRRQIEELLADRANGVFACSALKQSYREVLQQSDRDLVFIYLEGTKEQLLERIRGRTGHFMKAEMLESQLETLEVPQDAFKISISLNSPEIVDRIVQYLQKLEGSKT